MKRVGIVGTTIVSGLLCVGLVAGTGARAQQPPEARPVQGQSQGVQQGQAPATAPAPAPQRQASPAAKALNEASALKDVDEKIAAIQKVIADFPKTPQVDQANTLLLDALIKKGDVKGIQAQAKAMVTAAPDTSRYRIQRDVAAALLRGDVLLEDAEAYAAASAGSLDEKSYIEARRKEAEARATNAARPAGSAASQAAGGEAQAAAVATPLSGPASGRTGDEMYLARFKTDKQSTLSTLGQIYVKRGKTVEAEKTLREAYLLDKTTASAATAALKLAGFAKAAGRDEEQFEYLAGVTLAGRLTPEAYADLQAVYRTLHKGSLDGLEDALDARYEKEGPKPPEVKPYERAAGRTDRIVLAEVFTGSGCPPCVAADLAFESAMHRYGSTELAVLMYHLHVPRPDPMTNPYSQARSKFYAVAGVPTYVIDGEAKSGGGSAENAGPFFTGKVEPAVDKRLSITSEAGLKLSGKSTDKTVRATVSITPADTKATHVRLHLVLVEDLVRYSGENGIRFHPMVVRAMAGDPNEAPKPAPATSRPAAAAPDAAPAPTAKEQMKETVPVTPLGFVLEPGKARTVSFTFDLAKVVADGLANLDDLEKNSTRYPNHKFAQKKHQVDPKRLRLVAFVQDEDSKQVLQAASLALGKNEDRR